MFSSSGRVLSSLTRVAFSRVKCVHNATPTVGKLTSVQSLTLSSQRSAKSKAGDEEVNSEPIKFSTSKASHRTWKVGESMGATFERPLGKVLPLVLVFTSILLWCAVRSNTDIDLKLQEPLFEHSPNEDEE